MTKEYYHIKQHQLKPPSHTFMNNIIYKLKSIYVYDIRHSQAFTSVDTVLMDPRKDIRREPRG